MTGQTQELALRLDKPIVTEADLVFQFEIETRSIAEIPDRRRYDRKDLCIRHLGENLHRACDDGRCSIFGGTSVLPVAQLDEGNTDILAGARETEAGGSEDRFHIVLFGCEIMLFDFAGDVAATRLNRARRQREEIDDLALIFVRQKTRREPDEQQCRQQNEPQIGEARGDREQL